MIRRAKLGAALAVYSAAYVAACASIGAAIRGRDAQGVGRDLAAGALVIGAAAAVQWSARELGFSMPPGVSHA